MPTAFSMPRFMAAMARAAIFAAAGWAVKTGTLPAARTLMALPAMVGAECVAGSAMAMTPQGAASMMRRTREVGAHLGPHGLDTEDLT